MQSRRVGAPEENAQRANVENSSSSALVNSNTKVGKLIRELRENVSHRNIVLLLLEIAERPDICVDFNLKIPSYLRMFLDCPEDIALSEAGHLILSAAKIYSRRVDHIQECIEKIISGMDNGLMQAEEGRQKKSPRKRAIKRPRTEQDPLYEAEVAPKQLRTVALTKTTETLTSLSTFDAPTHYFKQWKKYKEWRIQYNRKRKCPIPYSTLHDNVSLHPSLWKLSCIEDFDYEDDIDTKRNYRVFTNYIEYRHSALFNDINFKMHFKVKDFIEAEEDEIEIMNILGLPAPPKRIWPPICKVASREEKDHDGSTISSEDYINNYLELENALLENEDYDPSYEARRVESQQLFEEYLNKTQGKNTIHNFIEAKCNSETGRSENIEIELNLFSEPSQSGACNSVEANNHFEDSLVNIIDEEPQKDSICDNIKTLPGIDKNQNDANNQSEHISLNGSQNFKNKQLDTELSSENAVLDLSQGNTVSNLSEGNPAPDSTKANMVPDLSQGNPAPDLSQGNPATDISQGNPATDLSQGNPAPDLSQGNPTPDLSQGNPVRDLSQENPVPDLSQGNPIPDLCQGNPAADLSHGNPATDLTQGNSTADLSQGNIVPELYLANTESNSTENSSTEKLIDTNTNASNLPVSSNTCNVSEDKLPENHNEADINKSTENGESRLNDNTRTDFPGCDNVTDTTNDKFLNNNIIIRISVDEGIALSDLDEIDRAMLSPVVELVDILKPIMDNISSPTDLVFQTEEPQLSNFFETDENFLKFSQELSLSISAFLVEEEIKINILKIPERILRNKRLFKLPEDFNLFKKDRCKRKSDTVHVEKRSKICKLNNGPIRCEILTPPPSPCTSEDFLGFAESPPLPESNLTDSQNIFEQNENINESILTGSQNILEQNENINESVLTGSQNILEQNENINESDLTGSQNIFEQNENINISDCQTTPGKTNRSFSRDSGIGNSATDNLRNSLLEERCSDGSFVNENAIEQSIGPNDTCPGNPILQSTAIESDICDIDVGNTPETLRISSQLPENGLSTDNLLQSVEKPPSEVNFEISIKRPRNILSPNLFEDDASNYKEFRLDPIPHASHQDPTERNAVDLNVMIEKVQKWHRYLKPILNQSKDRHHFDVFKIGTEIIEKFAETETGRNKNITFEDVMKEKDPSYISRYFLSSLLLANQNNISLHAFNENKEEPVSPNKIQLTLQSKLRHNVSMEDDIGSSVILRRRVNQPDADSQSSSDQSEQSIGVPSESVMDVQEAFVRENDERYVDIMRNYRISYQEVLRQQVAENRDDYIRILSRKYDIDLGLYFTEEEIRRLQTENIRGDFESSCLIYPKNINIRQSSSKNGDDSDSGFHSHNTGESESEAI